MSSPSGLRPAPARGTLATVPIAQALVYLRDKRLTGAYELSSDDGRRARLVIWRGRVAHAVTAPAVARLGAVARELGLVDAETLDRSAAESTRRRVPLLDLLLERGALSAEGRARVLVAQLERRVHHLFTFPDDAAFAFHESSPSADEPTLAIDPLASVWRGLAEFPPLDRIRAVVEGLGDAPLVMVDEAALERVGLGAEVRAACELVISTPCSLAELATRSRLPRASLEGLVYFLVLARCMEPATARATSGMRAAVARPAHRPPSFQMPHVGAPREGEGRVPDGRALPTPEELGVDGVRARAALVGRESPHDALGVAPGASAEALRAAYFRLARRWSPERIPKGLEPVRAEIARVHAWLGASLRALLDATAAGG